jgi:hypothetical protein
MRRQGMSPTSTPKSIGLTELIYQVKRELIQPQGGTADPFPLLAVEEVELEISVTVSKRAEGGLNIQVVELGGGRERSDVHTVRVKLSPLLAREERVTELRRDPRWERIVQQQVDATLKGGGQELQKDSY